MAVSLSYSIKVVEIYKRRRVGRVVYVGGWAGMVTHAHIHTLLAGPQLGLGQLREAIASNCVCVCV